MTRSSGCIRCSTHGFKRHEFLQAVIRHTAARTADPPQQQLLSALLETRIAEMTRFPDVHWFGSMADQTKILEWIVLAGWLVLRSEAAFDGNGSPHPEVAKLANLVENALANEDDVRRPHTQKRSQGEETQEEF